MELMIGNRYLIILTGQRDDCWRQLIPKLPSCGKSFSKLIHILTITYQKAYIPNMGAGGGGGGPLKITLYIQMNPWVYAPVWAWCPRWLPM